MKLLNLKSLAFTALAVGTIAGYSAVNAQTVAVPVTATVANVITVNAGTDMAFGTLVAINDDTDQAYIAVGTDGNLSAPNNTGDAFIIDGGGTKSAASVSFTAVSGATVTIDITSITSPQLAGDILALSDWEYDLNTTNSATNGTTFTPGVGAFTVTATAGPDTLNIGARITTPQQVALIGDGDYIGTFTVAAGY